MVQVVHQQPAIVAELIRDVLGVKLPERPRAHTDSIDLSSSNVADRRADAVVILTDPTTEAPALGVIVEVQLSQDRRKWWSWPAYLITLRNRHRIPVMLLVLCLDPHIASWCARAIELGPGWTLPPFVAGPAQIPKITSTRGRDVTAEMAVLSALAHATDPDMHEVVSAVPPILATIDPDQAVQYSEIMSAALQGSALDLWETLMGTKTFEFQSRYANRLRAEARAEALAEGEVKGEARMLLRVLEARGIDVPEDVRARIAECADPDQLETWADRAVTATSIHDLFD